MEWVETSLGRVPVWGSYKSDRPLVLAIRGAYAALEDLTGLNPPGCDLALLHLPGFHSPPLISTSIGAFIAAFDSVIRQRFRGRTITAVGMSAGAIVALGLQSPEIRSVLAIEPFFSTAKLWPMVDWVRDLRPEAHTRSLMMAKAIFGMTPESVENRDYHAVLGRRDRPMLALVGDLPLHPRRLLPIWPSFTDEEDRSLLPHIVTAGGHQLPGATIRQAAIDMLSRGS